MFAVLQRLGHLDGFQIRLRRQPTTSLQGMDQASVGRELNHPWL
jgi:hypothetical protein